MKKFLSILVLILLGLGLVACGESGNGGNNGGNQGGNGGSGGNGGNRTIYLTYAEWGDQDVAQAMIDAFEAAYPNIKVTLDTSITGSGTTFTTNLISAAQGNMLPDVFVTDNVPSVIKNGLVYDISEFWDKDPDAAKVYSNIAKTAIYKDASGKVVRLAAPSYQFIKGFFVNQTLLTNLGMDVPGYDWTFDDFYEISKDILDMGVNADGTRIFAINGYYGALDFEKAMTAQTNSGLGYDSWNGSRFNYESEQWLKYRRYTEEFYQTGMLEQLTAEEKEQIYGNESAWPFEKGHTAFAVEGSWNILSYLDSFQAANMKVEFYPYPAGDTANEAVILDYMCVSSLTDYPEEAYELMKWMSFGEEGWKARLEIMKKTGKGIDRFPVANYPKVWEDIIEYMEELNETHNYSGYIYCIDHLSDGAPDVDKWLPGYSDFWNYINDTNEEEDWYNKPTDQLAREWTILINQKVQEAYEALNLQPVD